jgi:SAM-dependent methyltransferase
MLTDRSAPNEQKRSLLEPVGTCDKEGLSEFVTALTRKRSSDWAWSHYKETIKDLVAMLGARHVMEIGGGRWPLFSKDEILFANIRYVVSDIMEKELALAPAHVEKICFDIAQHAKIQHNEVYDLMFSQMVFEHVADTYQAYRNIYLLLAPGGVCLNFHPVLYSPPFVINKVLPEWVSSRVLRTFFPNRKPDEVPKHPAKYDHCKISTREQDALRSIGFSKVWQVPFWYHDYFKKFPGLYHLDLAAAKLADRNNWTAFASYCYTLVVR